jgi:hydrogenase expression/formation protein HypE
MSDQAGIDFNNYSCPADFPNCRESGKVGRPIGDYECVLLGHGSGGTLTADLIQRLFLTGFAPVSPSGLNTGQDKHVGPRPALEDQATLTLTAPGGNGGKTARIAMTTDSFVVRPLFFPGGDIGSLSIHGTVNDLAVGGATPLYLSAAFILEEGLPMDDLRRIVASMQKACEEAGVSIVTGDTKVVDRGKGDQIFITTTGVGIVPKGRCLSVRNARPGDKILISGTIGDHGIAIMSVREGIEFETVLKSDCASLHDLTRIMLIECPSIRWMRDPTRGGLSSSLNELADASNVGVKLHEAAIPVRPEVQAACAILGLDPLYVANEGKLVAVVPPGDADQLLEVMRGHPLGRNAALIGEIVDEHCGMVIMRSYIGGERVVTMLTGEQLPRIC